MSFKSNEPLFYLVNFRHNKAGTPVKVRYQDIARLRMLGARQVIGTAEELNSDANNQRRLKDIENAEETKVVISEEVSVEIAEEASVESEEPVKEVKINKPQKKKGKK